MVYKKVTIFWQVTNCWAKNQISSGLRRRAGVERVGEGCVGGKENEGRKGKGRGGEGGEAGSGAQPRGKLEITILPGVVGRSRWRFWTRRKQIYRLVKFQPNRTPTEEGPGFSPRKARPTTRATFGCVAAISNQNGKRKVKKKSQNPCGNGLAGVFPFVR